MQPDDALIFARECLAMLESDVFKTACTRVETRLFQDWQRTSPLDREIREQNWMQAHAVKLLINEFQVMAGSAVLERAKRAQETGESQVLRRPTIPSSTA